MPTWIRAVLIGAFYYVLALLLCIAIIAGSIAAGVMIGGTDAGGLIVAIFIAVALCGAVSGFLSWLDNED